jgi:hypothetical protein
LTNGWFIFVLPTLPLPEIIGHQALLQLVRFENMTPAELRAVAKSLRPGTRVRKSYLCHGDLNHKN